MINEKEIKLLKEEFLQRQSWNLHHPETDPFLFTNDANGFLDFITEKLIIACRRLGEAGVHSNDLLQIEIIRCCDCGEEVSSVFDHIDQDCLSQ